MLSDFHFKSESGRTHRNHKGIIFRCDWDWPYLRCPTEMWFIQIYVLFELMIFWPRKDVNFNTRNCPVFQLMLGTFLEFLANVSRKSCLISAKVFNLSIFSLKLCICQFWDKFLLLTLTILNKSLWYLSMGFHLKVCDTCLFWPNVWWFWVIFSWRWSSCPFSANRHSKKSWQTSGTLCVNLSI